MYVQTTFTGTHAQYSVFWFLIEGEFMLLMMAKSWEEFMKLSLEILHDLSTMTYYNSNKNAPAPYPNSLYSLMFPVCPETVEMWNCFLPSFLLSSLQHLYL